MSTRSASLALALSLSLAAGAAWAHDASKDGDRELRGLERAAERVFDPGAADAPKRAKRQKSGKHHHHGGPPPGHWKNGHPHPVHGYEGPPGHRKHHPEHGQRDGRSNVRDKAARVLDAVLGR